ncbi:hypothetical protein SAMN06265360_111147 [Haloechinothrix alba]|uniref:Uncharacterized protein n=1 Tax=Haloechinothrix alba TaxID=664784 RepID=A0A238XPG9_9PSEU|nr:hypothetical protein SAMN06265360_111147 [Haloechinothrix alba]
MAVVALVLLVSGTGLAGLLRFQVDTDAKSFLPAGDPSVEALEEHARSFGGEPIVVILESGNARELLLDQERIGALLGLEGQLSELPNAAAVYGPATVLNQTAVSAQQMLARIAGRRDVIRVEAEEEARSEGLGAEEAGERADRAVADFEARYGSLLLKGLPAGLPTLHNAQFVDNVVYNDSGEPRSQWRFVVPGADNLAVSIRPRENLDQGSTQELVSRVRSAVEDSDLEFSDVTVTGTPAVTAGVAHQVTRELPLLGGLAVVLLLGRFLLVPTQSGWMRRLWPLAAGLIGTAATLSIFGWLGISMSFGAIALLPLLLGVGTSFPLYLQTRTSRRRVLVTACATAAAFASLLLSPLPFVRELGMALSAGVLLTALTGLAVGPQHDGSTVDRAGDEPALSRASSLRKWRKWSVLAGVLALAGGGWATLPGASIEADPRELAKGVPAIEDAQHAEQVLGSSGELNVVLRGPDVLSTEALDWSRKAESELLAAHGDSISPILTVSGLFQFLGASPTADEIRAGMEIVPQYLTSAVVRGDGKKSVMNFGIKIQDLGQQGELLADMRETLPPPPQDYTVELVGLPVAADRAYTLLSENRYISNTAGIAAAGVVLLVGLRRRVDGLRGVLAATIATGWALGALSVTGIALTPLTVMLGAIAAVSACEFTVLLAAGRRLASSRTRRLVTWAAVTSAVGFLALVPSSLWLLREYGLVLTATVLLSYVAASAVVRLLPVSVDRGRATTVPALAHKEVSA